MREKATKKTDELEQSKLGGNENSAPAESTESVEVTNEAARIPSVTSEELDADEEEFKKIRRDLPGVKGSSAAGIVAISVGKAPQKNEFFRTHPKFYSIVSIVDHEVGMEKQYFAVTKDMIEPLAGIGITVSDYALYLTVTAGGAYRVVPVRQRDGDGEQNEYHRTKEIGLVRGIESWQRLYHDKANRCYESFPAPEGRYGEPQFPDLSEAKIFRLGFRDKGRLIDSTEHPLFKKWAGRDKK